MFHPNFEQLWLWKGPEGLLASRTGNYLASFRGLLTLPCCTVHRLSSQSEVTHCNHRVSDLGPPVTKCQPRDTHCLLVLALLLAVPAMQTSFLKPLPPPHISFYSPVTLQSFLFFLSLVPLIFLSASNFLGLDTAPYQQILVGHMFLLPMQLLFLYYCVCIIFVICLKWRK